MVNVTDKASAFLDRMRSDALARQGTRAEEVSSAALRLVLQGDEVGVTLDTPARATRWSSGRATRYWPSVATWDRL